MELPASGVHTGATRRRSVASDTVGADSNPPRKTRQCDTSRLRLAAARNAALRLSLPLLLLRVTGGAVAVPPPVSSPGACVVPRFKKALHSCWRAHTAAVSPPSEQVSRSTLTIAAAARARALLLLLLPLLVFFTTADAGEFARAGCRKRVGARAATWPCAEDDELKASSAAAFHWGNTGADTLIGSPAPHCNKSSATVALASATFNSEHAPDQ